MAAILLLISMANAPVSMALVFARLQTSVPMVFFAQSAVILMLWLALILLLWQRRGWARIGVLIMIFWTIISIALSVTRIGATINLLVPLASLALRMFAVTLLYNVESARWFSARRADY
ncbi:MAG TPA: hypothetical protein VMT15_02960 [Bryobacteraceae bacterium]|nr:hypothetical protein [Bryobacteraceae bacterium]